MKNYYRSIEESAWPLMRITDREVVENTFDDLGKAVKATLECGHHCILTGESIYIKTEIH